MKNITKEGFEKLVDPKSPRGIRKRQILKYIFEHEGSTLIEITAGVYGPEKVKDSYKSLRSHIRQLEDYGIVKTVNGKTRRIFLTDWGKELCEKENIIALSKEAEEFARVLNKWVLTNPLTSDEKSRLEQLLSGKTLEVLFAISDELPLPIPKITVVYPDGFDGTTRNLNEWYFELHPSIDVWRCLKGLWVYEMLRSEPPHRLGIKPVGIMLAEAHGLTRKLSDLVNFFWRLSFKNPILAELRDHVKKAFFDFKQRAPPAEDKEKEEASREPR